MTKNKEILNIQKKLNSFKYVKNKEFIYSSINLIEKEKQCICFDAALYAKFYLDTLKIPNLIITILLTTFNQKPVAHSICVFLENNKFGCLGKSSIEDLSYRPAKYENIEDLVLSFIYPAFKNNYIISSFGQEEVEEIYSLFIQSNKNIDLKNKFKPLKNKKTYSIFQIKEILNKYYKIDEKTINEKINLIYNI